MDNPFTKHPKSVGETYFQHMLNAFNYSFRLEWFAFIAFIHAIFPFWFKTSTGDGVKKLNKELQKRVK